MAIRFPLTQQPLRSRLGPVLSGAEVTIKVVDPTTGALGADATVFKDPSSGATVPQPVITNDDGICIDPADGDPVYLDDGIYAMVSPRLDYVPYILAQSLTATSDVTQAELDAVALSVTAVPRVSLSAGDYTLVLSDAGKAFDSGSTFPRVLTIPTIASVAFGETFFEACRSNTGTFKVQGAAPGMIETVLSATPVDFVFLTPRYAEARFRHRQASADLWKCSGDGISLT